MHIFSQNNANEVKYLDISNSCTLWRYSLTRYKSVSTRDETADMLMAIGTIGHSICEHLKGGMGNFNGSHNVIRPTDINAWCCMTLMSHRSISEENG